MVSNIPTTSFLRSMCDISEEVGWTSDRKSMPNTVTYPSVFLRDALPAE